MQTILFLARNYLEIGIKKSKAFLNIKAKKKIAVDPQIKISMKRKIKLKNFFGENLSQFFMEIEDYFPRNHFISS
jgi:hypothetical protein